jgi:hypothetical protein
VIVDVDVDGPMIVAVHVNRNATVGVADHVHGSGECHVHVTGT